MSISHFTEYVIFLLYQTKTYYIIHYTYSMYTVEYYTIIIMIYNTKKVNEFYSFNHNKYGFLFNNTKMRKGYL